MFFDIFDKIDTKIEFVTHAPKSEDNIIQNYTSPKIFHNELFFKFPGDNIMIFNGKTTHITAPTVGFLPKILDSKENIEYYIKVKKSAPSINIFFDCSTAFKPEALFFDCTNMPDLAPLFEKLDKTWNFQNTGYYAESMSYFYRIISILQKHFSADYLPVHKYNIISNSLKYIEENYLEQNFDFNKLAEISGISYSYYKKIFTSKFNMTPNQYVSKLKLNYACNLIRSRLYSVTEIAELAGYSSVYYFSHVFAKEFGTSPKKWLQQELLINDIK